MLCFILPNKQVLHFEITVEIVREIWQELWYLQKKKWCDFDVLKRLKERCNIFLKSEEGKETKIRKINETYMKYVMPKNIAKLWAFCLQFCFQQEWYYQCCINGYCTNKMINIKETRRKVNTIILLSIIYILTITRVSNINFSIYVAFCSMAWFKISFC